MPFSHKFIINESDVMKRSLRGGRNYLYDRQMMAKPQYLMQGFDPENDPKDERMLYEVTGLRLDQALFRDEDSDEESY